MPQSISGTKSDSLFGKVIVLGVTGSIAAVRAVDLIHEMIRRSAKVHCVMSSSARKILHPYALEYASENQVITEISGRVEHVEFCGIEGKADLFIVAPATANTIGKIACGIDDTPVTTFATTAIGSGLPVIVVPAMHEAMLRHPAVLKNLDALRSMNVMILGPKIEEGRAKIADNQVILREVERLLGPGDLSGRKILVTSGATAESIDPIRILTNRASGRTGVEIGLEAYRRGADVTIVHRSALYLPFREVYAESAQEMHDEVLKELESGYDALISAAAIGDYTIDPSPKKIKSGGDVTLRLRRAPKLIGAARSFYPDLKIVGFKAETNVADEELIKSALESMSSSSLDLVVANDVGKGGMGTSLNRVFIISRDGSYKAVSGEKSLIAGAVLDMLVEVLA